MNKIKLDLPTKAAMKNTEKVEGNNILKMLGFGFVGFVFSQIVAFGDFSPFAAAFASVCPLSQVMFAFVGAVLGFARVYNSMQVLQYIGGVAFVCIFKLFLNRYANVKDEPISDSLVAMSSILAANFLYMLFTEVTFILFVGCLAQAVTAFLFSLIFSHTIKIGGFKISFDQLRELDKINLLVSACVFLLCFSGFTFKEFSVARVMSFLLILLVANFKGVSVSTVVGVCVGFTLCIDKDYRYIIQICAITGVVAGLVSSFGSVYLVLSLIGTSVFVCIWNGFELSMLIVLAEVFVASLAFLVLPHELNLKIETLLNRTSLKPNDNINREVCANLQKAANSVGAISNTIQSVNVKLEKNSEIKISKDIISIQKKVCLKCSKKEHCWDKNYNSSADDLISLTKSYGKMHEGNKLYGSCLNQKELLQAIKSIQEENLQSYYARVKLKEMRSIVTSQFDSIAQFLSELAQTVSHSRVVDSTKSRMLRKILDDQQIFVDSLKFFTNPNGSKMIEITMLDSAFELDSDEIQTILQNALDIKLERAEIAIMELRTILTYDEKPKLKITCGYSQIPSGNAKVCGDCVTVMTAQDGNEIAMLSDGMGTGIRAAIDANMTSTIMKDLLSSGFSFDGSIKMVNLAMMMKSTDESISTVDAVSVNKYTKEAKFYKAGATISFLRHGQTVRVIEQASLSVGIIKNVDFATSTYEVEQGDIILLVSDGVISGDCGWINDELLAWSTSNMTDLARHVANLARIRSSDDNADDISAVAVKIAGDTN